MSPKARLAVFTVLLAIPALMLSALAASTVGPRIHTAQMSRVIFCQADDLRATIRVEMEGEAIAWFRTSPDVPLQTMTLSFDSPSGPELHVDLATPAWEYTDRNGRIVQQSGVFDQQALMSWLASAGVDVEKEGFIDQAASLLQAIKETPQARGRFTTFPVNPGRGLAQITAHPTIVVRRSHSPMWFLLIMLAFWLALWYIEARRILRRRPPAAGDPG